MYLGQNGISQDKNRRYKSQSSTKNASKIDMLFDITY